MRRRKRRRRPYVTIARHDVLPRDGDATPGHEHRLLLHVWATDASRRLRLEVVEIALAVASDDLAITLGSTTAPSTASTRRRAAPAQ